MEFVEYNVAFASTIDNKRKALNYASRLHLLDKFPFPLWTENAFKMMEKQFLIALGLGK